MGPPLPQGAIVGITILTWAVAEPEQPSLVATVTVYVPESQTAGFCCEEVNPFGPVQLYVTLGGVELAVN